MTIVLSAPPPKVVAGSAASASSLQSSKSGLVSPCMQASSFACLQMSPSQEKELQNKRVQADSFTYAQVPLSQEKQAQNSARPDKLAIGGEGGFQLEEDKYDIEKSQALTVLPEGLEIPLPCPDLPEIILNAIKGVMVRQ